MFIISWLIRLVASRDCVLSDSTRSETLLKQDLCSQAESLVWDVFS